MTTASIRDVLVDLCKRNEGGRVPNEPIFHDGALFATDGKIQIRARWSDGGPENPEWAARFLDLMRKFGGGATEQWTLPELGEFTEPCKRCKGTGEMSQCSECDGDGVIECDLGEEHECRRCRGTGFVEHGSSKRKVKCEECSGTGRADSESLPVAFGSVILGKNRLGVLTKLPDLRFAIADKRKAEDPVYFTFDGGDGLVMPMLDRGIDAELRAVRATEDGR